MTQNATVGNQLFIKNNFNGRWRTADENELQCLLQKNNSPVSQALKLKLPLFGYGRVVGSMPNTQLYPTNMVVLEIDPPVAVKEKIRDDDKAVFDEFSQRIRSLFEKWKCDDSISYHAMYVSGSLCGIRFILKTDTPLENEAQYKSVVRQFLEGLRADGIDETYYDQRVNQAWFLPTFEDYFHTKGAISRVPEFSEIPTSPINDIPVATLERVELDRPEDIAKVEGIIRYGKSITNTYERWYKTALGLANTFSYEVGKELYLRLCRLDGIQHNEEGSITKWEQCYRDKKPDGVRFGTVLFFAYENGISNYQTKDSMTAIPLSIAINKVKSLPEIPLVWRGIKKPSVNAVFGMAKCNKSILSENLAMSIAAGRESFLDDAITIDNRTVLVINFEEFFQNRINRNAIQFQELSEEEKQSISKNYLVIDERCPHYLRDEHDWEALTQLVELHQPGFLVLDSLSHLYIGAIERSVVAQEVVGRLRALAQKFDIAILLVHHSTKIDNKSLRMVDMAGSRIISQDLDGIIGMNRTQDKIVYLCDIAYRYAPTDELCKVVELTPDLWLKCIMESSEEEIFIKKIPDGRKDAANGEIVLEFISQKGETTTEDLKKAFVPDQMSNVTLHKWLNQYFADEKILKLRKGVYGIKNPKVAPAVVLSVPEAVTDLPIPPVNTTEATRGLEESPAHGQDKKHEFISDGIEQIKRKVEERMKQPGYRSKLQLLKEE